MQPDLTLTCELKRSGRRMFIAVEVLPREAGMIAVKETMFIKYYISHGCLVVNVQYQMVRRRMRMKRIKVSSV